MMAGRNICYDVDGRHQGTAHGGIGTLHQLAMHSGLINEIDSRVELLKRHLPYHESDHILNIAYNLLAGGSCLQLTFDTPFTRYQLNFFSNKLRTLNHLTY